MANVLRLVLSILAYLARTLAYGWVLGLKELLARMFRALKDLLALLKEPHPEFDETERDCTYVNQPAVHRPDPCIYSQSYLLGLGLPVTWDNPDIVVKKGGVNVAESALLPDTEYEIEATVWNNSYEAPVVGLKVIFSYLTFGVGTVSTAIGTTLVNLGVKGGVNHPARAIMPWKTPPTPGHYCLQVLLEWIDDSNTANNLGQNNLDVVEPQSPADFKFRLRNAAGKETRFSFEVDTYTLPPPPACKTKIGPDERGTFQERLRRARARHNRADYPVPAGWSVVIDQPQPLLAAGAETDIGVSITPPAGFTGTRTFNVNALAAAIYAGGVSLIVSKP